MKKEPFSWILGALAWAGVLVGTIGLIPGGMDPILPEHPNEGAVLLLAIVALAGITGTLAVLSFRRAQGALGKGLGILALIAMILIFGGLLFKAGLMTLTLVFWG